VDALDIAAAMASGTEALGVHRLQALCDGYGG